MRQVWVLLAAAAPLLVPCVARAGAVNPAPPLVPGSRSSEGVTAAQRRAGLQFSSARPGASHLVLRYYPEVAVGRVDAGLLRPRAAAGLRYDEYIAQLSGNFNQLRKDQRGVE